MLSHPGDLNSASSASVSYTPLSSILSHLNLLLGDESVSREGSLKSVLLKTELKKWLNVIAISLVLET